MDQGTDLLKGPFVPVSAPELESLFGVEGPAAFQLNSTGRWCLMLDQYSSNGGYLPLISDDLAKGVFRILQPDSYHLGDTRKRHGSVLSLSGSELDRLMDKYL
jgi:hypothetical protein